MELWIRSQNRRQLLKVSAVEYIYFQGNHCLNAHNTNESDNYDIGIYKSEERALEVLDEIQELIKPKIITKSYECECKDNLKDKMKFSLEMEPIKTEIQELSTYVYEMPED